MKGHSLLILSLLLTGLCVSYKAQVSYGASAAYSLRRLNPAYGGSAIQVQRTCDNGIKDIGFTACGDLDTVALKAFVIAANPLSATTVTAATAYSLRRLKCTYAGPAIKVRSNASGNPVLDIGFTVNGDLDTAALKTFIGSNSGFVTTWYDQSGNSRNATQAAAGNQPRIVNAGVIDRQGGMPAVRWLGSGYSLSTAGFTAYNTAACFNGVARVSSDLTYNTIVNKTTSNYPSPLDLYNGQVVIGNGPSYTFFSYGQTLNASLPLSIWTYQAAAGGSYNFYYNGGLTASGAVGAYGDSGNPLVLGSRADGMTGLNGWISEIITFDALPSATDRQFIEWSQSQYYSTGGPALASLPIAPASASVSVWYDQSGNSKHAVQATISNQPGIINAGVLEKNNANPAIYFNGLLKNLVAPLSASAYPVTISLLANTSGNSTAGAFVKLGDILTVSQAGIAIGIGNSGGSFLTPGTSVIGLKELVAYCPSSPNVNYPANPFTSTTIQQPGSGGMFTYLNGANVPLTSSASAVGASISGSLSIGGYLNTVNLFPAVRESELIIFSSALSNTARILLETDQAVYNNVTVANNRYTPPAAGSYCRYINGVGRESATDSVAGTKSTVGMGFMIGQTASDFLKDNGDYLTAGANCPVAAAVSTLNLPVTVVQRWNNDWYLNKTDVNANNGTINFFFDFSDYGMPGVPGVAANYELLARSSAAGTFSIVAGTTKSVAGDRIFFAVDASNISTNTYYTVGTKNTAASILPIELISFDASCDNNQAELNWSTATQTNNDYFSVERTADGVTYETLATIKGAGTNSQRKNYVYTDTKPLSGISYYRLKQTDFNGAYNYYKVVQVSCENKINEISIYPNPNTGLFMIEGADPHSNLVVYNTLGEQVYSQKNVSTKQPVNLGYLPNGIYFINVQNTSNQAVQKIIIRH